MPYVRRDDHGNIIELRRDPVDDQDQYVAVSDPGVLTFLFDHGSEDSAREFLAVSDTELSRVLEDLVAVLIERELIRLTDLPPDAQRKLNLRARARTAMHDDRPFSLDEDELL